MVREARMQYIPCYILVRLINKKIKYGRLHLEYNGSYGYKYKTTSIYFMEYTQAETVTFIAIELDLKN